MDDVETRRRDTSWVTGELSHHLDTFPEQLKRFEVDKRYHLIGRDDFDQMVAEDLVSSRSYNTGRYSNESFAPVLTARLRERWGCNGVGLVLDMTHSEMYNIVVYEQGGVEILDPDKEVITDVDCENIGAGVILL